MPSKELHVDGIGLQRAWVCNHDRAGQHRQLLRETRVVAVTVGQEDL